MRGFAVAEVVAGGAGATGGASEGDLGTDGVEGVEVTRMGCTWGVGQAFWKRYGGWVWKHRLWSKRGWGRGEGADGLSALKRAIGGPSVWSEDGRRVGVQRRHTNAHLYSMQIFYRLMVIKLKNRARIPRMGVKAWGAMLLEARWSGRVTFNKEYSAPGVCSSGRSAGVERE